MKYSLLFIEKQLKRRWAYPYQWGRKQNNAWDAQTNFVYKTRTWEDLIEKIKTAAEQGKFNKMAFFQYAANRWYNFWSAVAVEQLFIEAEGVVPAKNAKNRLKDFSLFGINFDHKTSVYPKRFSKPLEYAQQHPKELLLWLYQNQSQQRRKHFGNRLFVMVYASDGAHWKLKAEISWLKHKILNYVATFEASNLKTLRFENQKTALADIIWVVR